VRSRVHQLLAAAVVVLPISLSEPVAGQSSRDTLVSVGTHRLHFRIFQGADRAVLLESGGGLDASQWDSLAPRIVEETGATVIAYDRAGLGTSGLPATPYDIREEVADLWRGLEHLAFTDDLLLVGHSYGGFMIQLEAFEHPDAVIGLVYIDPNLPSFVEAIGGSDALAAIEGPPPQGATKSERAVRRETEAFASSVSIVAESRVPASLPVRVITAGQPWWPTPELNKAWREAHELLANSVPDGELLVAEQRGHMITESEPDIIVTVVRELIGARRVP